jgi:hypothetical protein
LRVYVPSALTGSLQPAATTARRSRRFIGRG